MQLIYADNTSLNAWRQGDLTSAVSICSQGTQGVEHHRLANLALVRARLGQWDLAEQAARAAIQVQSTVLAHVAVGIALGGQGKLASAKREFNQVFLRHAPKNNCLLLIIKSIIIFVAGDHDEATRRVADLVEVCEETNKPLCRAVQAQMQLLVGLTAVGEQDYQEALGLFASAGALTPFLQLPELETISLIFGWDFDSLLLVIRQQTCEALYGASRMGEAVQSLRAMLNEFEAEMTVSAKLSDWVQNFTRKCAEASQTAGDMAVANGKHDEAIVHYSVALSLDPPSRADLFLKRNQARLAAEAWDDAMKDLDEAGSSRFTLYTQIGEALLAAGRMKEATDILLRLRTDLGDGIVKGDKDVSAPAEDTNIRKELAAWELDYRGRCLESLEKLGDASMDSKRSDEAVGYYSNALLLNPINLGDILVKRSKVLVMMGSWEEALKDADRAIEVDGLSPLGYERRHAALHALQRYSEAVDAFTSMLSLIEESPDQDIRRLGEKYVSPARLETAIDSVIREVFRISPLALIDTKSGRLCGALERIRLFKSEMKFQELISSMVLQLDNGLIHGVVEGYFQYVTFSHVWQGKEPSFQDVSLVGSAWNLDPSPLNDKLRKFCEVVRENGYQWAWSDTCCIDKTISTVLNQSLIMMYKWYEASAATLVFLVDVMSPSTLGDLTKSIWMTRAWTLQELLATKAIRFYDRDWKPYLGDNRPNHKGSPEIMQELADAMGISRETIIAFNPGDLNVREKLRLASTRNATIEEDIAYSLVGIFRSDIRPNYGEGATALGHLLEEIVARSGEVTVLAWTGKSSRYNSCLPTTLAVYSQPPWASPIIDGAEMDTRVAALQNSLSRTDAILVYNRITRLTLARFVNRRLYLPCIIFTVKKLGIQDLGSGQGARYRARTPGIGNVEFQTLDRLPLAEPRRLIFVYPWIRDPLDGSPLGGIADIDEHESDPETEAGSALPSPVVSPPSPRADDYTRALRLVVRLQRPFRVLLLQQQPNGEFKRVAAEHEIIVPGIEPGTNFTRDIHAEVIEIL